MPQPYILIDDLTLGTTRYTAGSPLGDADAARCIAAGGLVVPAAAPYQAVVDAVVDADRLKARGDFPGATTRMLRAYAESTRVALGHIGKSTWTAVKVAAYTAAPHDFVKYDPTAGAFAITLPSAVGLDADDSIALVNVGTSTNAVTVGVEGGVQTIRGNGGVTATTYVLSTAGQTSVFVPDGIGWQAFPGT